MVLETAGQRIQPADWRFNTTCSASIRQGVHLTIVHVALCFRHSRPPGRVGRFHQHSALCVGQGCLQVQQANGDTSTVRKVKGGIPIMCLMRKPVLTGGLDMLRVCRNMIMRKAQMLMSPW